MQFFFMHFKLLSIFQTVSNLGSLSDFSEILNLTQLDRKQLFQTLLPGQTVHCQTLHNGCYIFEKGIIRKFSDNLPDQFKEGASVAPLSNWAPLRGITPLEYETVPTGYFTRGKDIHLRGYVTEKSELYLAKETNGRAHLLFTKKDASHPTIVTDLCFLTTTYEELQKKIQNFQTIPTPTLSDTAPTHYDLSRAILHPHMFEIYRLLTHHSSATLLKNLSEMDPKKVIKVIKEPKTILIKGFQHLKALGVFLTMGDFKTSFQQLIGKLAVHHLGDTLTLQLKNSDNYATIDLSLISTTYLAELGGKSPLWTLKALNEEGHEILSLSGSPSDTKSKDAFNQFCENAIQSIC